MKKLQFLLQKEFRQIFRDKTIIAMMFAVPAIQLTIMPLAMNLDVKNINISVVDHDNSTYSQKLISKIASSGYFKITSADFSYQQALTHIENGSSDLLIELPAGFERNLVREGQQKIGVSIDAINGTKSALGGAYLNAVIEDFNKNISLNRHEISINDSQGGAINLTYSNWYNPQAQYKFYIVPGVLVLLLTLIGGFMAALNIVREKEVGTIEQINVTPIKKWQFILGKLIPFWVIGMIVFTIGLIVCWGVYGIVSVGSLSLLYATAALYLVALLGFGLLISTYSNSQVQAMFIAFFFIMIFIMMSGLFTSVESMPAWARSIANMIPVTHFMRIVRMIMLKGSNFSEIKTEFSYILAFAVVLNSWAIWNYKKTS